MDVFGDKARLSDTVFMLPHYIIKPAETIKIGGINVYKKMSLGVPNSIYRIKTPQEVVKKLLLSRVTISALRDNELTKKEAQKHFLVARNKESQSQEHSSKNPT